ncbi:MAG: pseudouridine synthase [Alphaproteobacteria bacterium]
MADMDITDIPAPARPEGERIAKRIARAGVCSRRDAEKLIAAGRVTVNGTIITGPALNVTPSDVIAVDGTALSSPERARLFRLHKIKGRITTARDPEGRPTIFDDLPPGLPRLITVGRLDFNTEGLLLLTNDGELAHALELPATGWMRRYRVRAYGPVDETALARLARGITLEGIDYGPVEARLESRTGANCWLDIGIREGKNREVRKILAHLGLTVSRLIRIAFGPFQLGSLAPGAVEEVPRKVLLEQCAHLMGEEGREPPPTGTARAKPRPQRRPHGGKSARGTHANRRGAS